MVDGKQQPVTKVFAKERQVLASGTGHSADGQRVSWPTNGTLAFAPTANALFKKMFRIYIARFN